MLYTFSNAARPADKNIKIHAENCTLKGNFFVLKNARMHGDEKIFPEALIKTTEIDIVLSEEDE